MPRIGYFIKNVRENDNPTSLNTAAEVDVNFPGTPDWGGGLYDMFYQWPADLTADAATGSLQGVLAYATLIDTYPNIYNAIESQPSTGFDAAHVIQELSEVYDETTVNSALKGDEFRLRVGKRIYIFGYAYSAADEIDPASATIKWKD